MMLKSERQKIKSIGKWRYEVALMQDTLGVYHVVAENLLTGEATDSLYTDFRLASFIFEAAVASFEGT